MEEHKCGKNLQRALGEMFVIDKEILKDEMDSFTISIKNEMPMEKAIDLTELYKKILEILLTFYITYILTFPFAWIKV